MLILLLAAVCCVGAASADDKWTDPGNYNESWYELEGGDSATTYHVYDAASLAALAVTTNSLAHDFDGKTILIMNDISLAGHDWVSIGTSTNKFKGRFEGDGNGKIISDFIINDGSDIGLIGWYAGSSIKNITIRNFSVYSTGSDVGGLVGEAQSGSIIEIENVRGEFGNVRGIAAVGGLLGSVDSTINLKYCTLEHSVVASPNNNAVGGLVGGVYVSIGGCSFSECNTLSCSISGKAAVGGLVGRSDSASSSPFMNESTVRNCIISSIDSAPSDSGYVGGLVGNAGTSAGNGIKNCVVENCVVAGPYYVGGLVGYAKSASDFTPGGNWLKESAIRGTGVDVGSVVGYDAGKISELYPSVQTYGSIWLHKTSNVMNLPRVIIAKSDVPAKQGPENPAYFNKMGTTTYFGEPTGVEADIVVQLTGYGNKGQYSALAYVIDSSPLIFYPGITEEKPYTGTVKLGAHTINPYSVTGYIFNGWNLISADGTMLTDAEGTLLNSVEGYTNEKGCWNNVSGTTVELYAKWTAKQTTATLDAQGGTGGTAQVTATYNAEMPAATMPTKIGYTFDGYYDAASAGTQYYNADGNSAKKWDKTDDTTILYAHWTANKYIVSFDAKGGSPTPNDIEETYDSNYKLPTTNPTKEGHTFAGWWTAASGGEQVTTDTKVTITAAQTLYANWTVNQYTITFDSKGGSSVAPITQNYNTDVTAPADPTKKGYTFSEWDPVVPATMPAKNTECVAQWTANQTTVTLNTDGGSSSKTTVTAIYEQNMPALTAAELPTKTGYTFTGYFDTNSKQYYNADGTSKAVWDKDVTKETLYANWTANTYTVHFDANGGTGTMADQSFTYDEGEKALSENKFTNAGHTFEGWADSKTGEVKYKDKASVSNLASTKDAVVNLYAVWKIIEVKKEPKDGKVEIPEDKSTTVPATPQSPAVKVVAVDGVTQSVTFKVTSDKAAPTASIPGFNSPTVFTKFEIETTAETNTKFVIDIEKKDGYNPQYIFLRHYSTTGWDNDHIAGKYLGEILSGFFRFEFPITACSPFAVVYETPVKTSSSSSSRDTGASIWLPATAEPTAAPTEAQPTQAVPTAAPVQPTQAPATPAPFLGLLAGLGAAAVFFGLRRK